MSTPAQELYDLEVIAGLLQPDELDPPETLQSSEKTDASKKVEDEPPQGLPKSETKLLEATESVTNMDSVEDSAIPGLEESMDMSKSDALDLATDKSAVEVKSQAEDVSQGKEIGSSLSSILAKHNLELASDSGSEDSDLTSEELSEEEEGSSESGSEESSDSESSSSSSSSEDSLPSREAIEIDEEEGSEQGTKISKQHKKEKAKLSRLIAEDSDLEDSDSATGPKGGVLATAHEIVAPTVTLPSITEIGPDEPMELIGEVLNVVDSVVVVKSYDHGMQKVLDTESLLVFEDRKVLGLVFETFGPLTVPFYSVRFPAASHLPPILSDFNPSTPIKIYHNPGRSTFAYTSKIRMQKGNDASNFYDEEVGEDELEFSDDEKEAEWRRKTGSGKRKRKGSRAGSVPNERYGGARSNFNDEQEPGISLSYDDPYEDATSESGNIADTTLQQASTSSGLPPRPSFTGVIRDRHRTDQGRGRGRGQGRGDYGKRGGRTRNFDQPSGGRRDFGQRQPANAFENGYSYQQSPFSQEYDPTQATMRPPPSSNSYNQPYWSGRSHQNMNLHHQYPTVAPQVPSLSPSMGFPGPIPSSMGATALGMGMGGPLPGAHINPHFAMMQLLSQSGTGQAQGLPPRENTGPKNPGDRFGPSS